MDLDSDGDFELLSTELLLVVAEASAEYGLEAYEKLPMRTSALSGRACNYSGDLHLQKCTASFRNLSHAQVNLPDVLNNDACQWWQVVGTTAGGDGNEDGNS